MLLVFQKTPMTCDGDLIAGVLCSVCHTDPGQTGTLCAVTLCVCIFQRTLSMETWQKWSCAPVHLRSENAGMGSMWHSMEHHCPVEDTLIGTHWCWSLFCTASIPLMFCTAFSAPSIQQNIRASQIVNIMNLRWYMFVHLFIDSFALLFAQVGTENNLLRCMSKVRHLNSLTGSGNRSGPVSKAIFKLFGWFSSFAAVWCGWEDSEDALHKDVWGDVCVLWAKWLWANLHPVEHGYL